MVRFFQAKSKTPLETKHQEVVIERLDHLGAGIAYQNNKAIFIEGALPGERVLVQFSEQKSHYDRANLIQVLEASPKRIVPFCRHYAQCGGCNLQHLSNAEQLKYKEQALVQLMSQAIPHPCSLQPTISSLSNAGNSVGYRRRARISLAVDKKTTKPQLQFGFRKKQSKQIVTLTDCPVLDPQLNSLLEPLYQLLCRFSEPQKLGHVELVLGDAELTSSAQDHLDSHYVNSDHIDNGQVVVVLRYLKALEDEEQQWLLDFAKQYQVTLYTMPQTETLNLSYGKEVYYSEVGVKVAFNPHHFIQVNRQVNSKMVEQAQAWLELTEHDRVLDLFCGIGNFSLPIAKQVEWVVGVEGVEEMVQQASYNAALNQINNVDFYQADLEQKEWLKSGWAAEKFDKILLDPARAGASSIIEWLPRLGAERIVYVSCNPSTLARDSNKLFSKGYRLDKLGMLDMFPHTSHLESMALFIKDRNIKKPRKTAERYFKIK